MVRSVLALLPAGNAPAAVRIAQNPQDNMIAISTWDRREGVSNKGNQNLIQEVNKVQEKTQVNRGECGEK